MAPIPPPRLVFVKSFEKSMPQSTEVNAEARLWAAKGVCNAAGLCEPR